jgi:CDGSH-type Zn-finger protein/uncharacterized Fe-S cluster protein YjdI
MAKKQYHDYEGESIRVRFEPRRCIHAAECIRGAPEVFDRHGRPWIKPDLGDADVIAEVVMRCPTGALHFDRLDGGASDSGPEGATARVVSKGPLYIRGDLWLKMADGTELPENRLALCRCGASENKPFCDNSHLEAGFSDEGELGSAELPPIEGDTGTELHLQTATNGPIIFQGAVEITNAVGRQSAAGSRGAFCRCGASGNKPYCDGSHKSAGFEAD